MLKIINNKKLSENQFWHDRIVTADQAAQILRRASRDFAGLSVVGLLTVINFHQNWKIKIDVNRLAECIMLLICASILDKKSSRVVASLLVVWPIAVEAIPRLGVLLASVFTGSPYPARAGWATAAGSLRIRLAPPGRVPVFS